MNSPTNNDLYRQERTDLLRYYNSQCMTHGGYVISIAVGLSILISRFDVFFKVGILYVFFIIIIGFLLLLIYLGSGTLYWGYLASNVMYIPVAGLSELKKELTKKDGIEPTDMLVLHTASFRRVKKYHSGTVEVKNLPYRYLFKFLSVRKICPNCETVNVRDSVFCSKCGKKIT